jgi:hypothetical protein
LTPRRGNAPPDASLPRRRRSSDGISEREREQVDDPLDIRDKSVEAEVDANLRPLARALLALAEQLRREDAP